MGFPASPKDRGHLAELILAVEVKRRGLTVLTTGGENSAFDLVVYNESGKFIRVQVKSCLGQEAGRSRKTFTIKRGGGGHHRKYTKEEIDVLALYTFDTDEWYFVPVDLVGESHSIKIDDSGKMDIFRENWSVFD